jgi:uncharacterized coiled-coil DUF342 family protein
MDSVAAERAELEKALDEIDLYRSNVISEAHELVSRYENLRSESGWTEAVHARVQGQLNRLCERYPPARLTMDANRAKSKVDSW